MNCESALYGGVGVGLRVMR